MTYLPGSSNGSQNLLISQHLDTNGDGSGSINANGDYSSVEGIFYIQPPAGKIYRIARLMVAVRDSNGFTPVEYGNIGSALTNGINLEIYNGSSVVTDFTNGSSIKNNAQWGGLCYDVDLKTWGTSDEILLARFTFVRSGQFIRLDGDATESLRLRFNDDLSGLDDHHFMVQGYQESNPT